MKNKMPENIQKISACLEEGSKIFKGVGKSVAVFGSARLSELENSKIYNTIRALGAQLAEAGFVVITGGGPGLMEAANRGAHEVGGQSAGVALDLGGEPLNKFVDPELAHTAEFFSTRKFLQEVVADAFVIVPGGAGTMDEFFEVFTLMITGRLCRKPIIVFNHKGHYEPLKKLLDHFVTRGTLAKDVLKLISFVDTVEDVVKLVKKGVRCEAKQKNSIKVK